MYRSWLQPALARERFSSIVGSKSVSGRLLRWRGDLPGEGSLIYSDTLLSRITPSLVQVSGTPPRGDQVIGIL